LSLFIGLVLSVLALGTPQPAAAAIVSASAPALYGCTILLHNASSLSPEAQSPRSVLEFDLVDQTVVPNRRQQRWQIDLVFIPQPDAVVKKVNPEGSCEKLPFSQHPTCFGRPPPSI
jgi:hypothetical protein